VTKEFVDSVQQVAKELSLAGHTKCWVGPENDRVVFAARCYLVAFDKRVAEFVATRILDPIRDREFVHEQCAETVAQLWRYVAESTIDGSAKWLDMQAEGAA
jgi:hypothetical protein